MCTCWQEAAALAHPSAKEQEGCALGGKKAPRPHFLGQIYRFWGFLDPFDQTETYHTSNGDKIEHMNETCQVDEQSL